MNVSVLRPHRFWLTGLGFALLLALATAEGSAPYEAKLAQTHALLEARRTELSAQLKQWREDAREARALSQALQGDSIETYLAPMDRAGLADALEPLAAAMPLSAMTFTLGPAAPWAGNPAFPNVEGLVQSPLTIEAQAALDTDVFRFIEKLNHLPGRLTLQKLSIQKTNTAETAASGLLNLHVKMDLLWLANAAKKEPQP